MADRTKMASNVLGPLATLCAIGIFVFSPSAARAQAVNQDQGQPAAQPAAQTADKPNLAGSWKLNKDQSDDPRQKMREAMGMSSGQGGQGDQGGQSESGNQQRPGAGRPGRGEGPRGGGMMAEWNELNIEETGTTVKVTGVSGRLLATTEAQEKPQANDSGDNGGMRFPPAAAQWQGNQLTAKSQGFGGGTTTRTFELSPDGKQLNVTTKIENERFNQPVTFKLVYDRGTPGDKNSQ
jgi:hypothetical protein